MTWDFMEMTDFLETVRETDWLDFIAESETEEILLDRFYSYLKSRGVTRFIYTFLPCDATLSENAIVIHDRGYEEHPFFPKLVKKLAQSRLGANYLKSKISGLTAPFAKGDDFLETLFGSHTPENRTDAVYWKTRNPVFFPVFGAESTSGVFSFSQPETQHISMRTLQMICQLVHHRYCELWEMPEGRKISLSKRESEVLYWMLQGKSNGEIASILSLSTHTVSGYFRSIFLKLGVHDKVSAALKATATGMVDELSENFVTYY